MVAPTGFYEKMVELGFDITAYYFEGGCGVCGKWVDGHDDNYSTDSRAERAEIPQDIADFCHGGDGWAGLYDEASDDEDDEEHVRRARYKGGAVALAAYRDLEAMGACCLICHVSRAEHEEEQRVERVCPPCSEEIAIKALFVVPLCATPVTHLYHRKCLKNWLKHPDHNTCPICATEIVEEDTPLPSQNSVPQSQVSTLEAYSTQESA